MNLSTIPADKPFISTLARWILEQYGLIAADLPRLLVLLPNRRSCRALREAFLEITAGKPLLLPRIQPIGDMDEPIGNHYQSLNADTPPAISSVRREFLLTRLVMDFKKRQSEATFGRIFNIEQAAELAKQLARFMDETARFGLNFERLAKLVPDELAAHWQQTLDFLTLISHAWPAILEGEGAIDPVEHRNLLLVATAKAWQKTPPNFPIIAAGSTGSSPATAALLNAIANLPQGQVILPGLDTDMPQSEWDVLTETHPQFGLKQLLEKMECVRTEITPLSSAIRHPSSDRLSCLRAILQSPEATSHWSQVSLPLQEGLKNIQLLTADTLHDEARMIAISLRETLETPGKTAALVTPDRTLARMVAAQMHRFGVEVDDSAGHALADTPTGCFLRLLIDMVASQAAPAALLALLRHPFAAAGFATAQLRLLSRQLEIELLRGLRRTPGLAALRDATTNPALKKTLATMEENLRPLFACFQQKSAPLRTFLDAHIECAQWLASTESEPGEDRLWSGEAGNSLAQHLSELRDHADVLSEIDPITYPGLFDIILAGQSYYPRFGLHPRLHILSPMEARLQHFDRVILGSLNEGTWPGQSEIDPWMSRPMRERFGLPPAEQSIGQSAHDIYMLCASGDILLTRSQKVDGTPTVPSRWLVRLETLVGGIDPNFFNSMQANAYYEEGKRLLDAAETLPIHERPEPKPPLSARPRKLRVTAIDDWISDPYRVYARYILNLRKLSDLDENPDAADFGNLVHKTLELFTSRWPSELPDQPLSELIQCGRETFAEMIAFPAVASLWWPRFEAMAEWIIEQEIACRGMVHKILAEIKGEWNFPVDGNNFTLTTTIDRLEYLRDGSVAIIDYKTGIVPTKSDIEAGKKNQLLLEALMAMHGRFTPALDSPINISRLEYWKLSGRHDSAKKQPVDTALIAAAHIRLEGLIRRYDDANTAYAASTHATSQSEHYNDYRHLTRRQEWGEG